MLLRLLFGTFLLIACPAVSHAGDHHYLSWDPPPGIDHQTVTYRVYSAPPRETPFAFFISAFDLDQSVSEFDLKQFIADATVTETKLRFFPIQAPKKDWDYGIQAVIDATGAQSPVYVIHLSVPKQGQAGWPGP